MPNTLLTEFQSACRAAHEQVQLLEDLYEHLCRPESNLAAAPVATKERIAELLELQALLSQKLKEQDLLPTQPDPERESLLELITGMKAGVTGAGEPAAAERLVHEESELLQHLEKMLEQEDDASLEQARGRTREAIARLSDAAAEAGGGG